MEVKGCRNETTGAISLGNEADKKKNTGEWSSERGVINQMCFCIIGNLVFLCACRFFFLFFFMRFFKNDKDAHKHGLG